MYMVLIRIGMTMTTTAAGSRLPIKSRPAGGKAVAQAVKLCGGALGPF